MKTVEIFLCKKGSFGRINLAPSGRGVLLSEEGNFGLVRIEGGITRTIGKRPSVGNLVYR